MSRLHRKNRDTSVSSGVRVPTHSPFETVLTNSTNSTKCQRTFYVPRELWKIFQRICGSQGRSCSQTITDLITEYCRKNEESMKTIRLDFYIRAAPGSQVNIAGQKVEAKQTINQQKTFTTTITRIESDPLFGDREIEKAFQVTEGELIDLLRQWPLLSENAKQTWRQILKQVDHPIAKDILNQEEVP